MAEEARGLPYYSSNPTGAGAVYFDRTVDPLQVHLQGLDDFNKRQEEDRVNQQNKLALGYKMLGDLNPDVKGIMDTDAGYFKEKLQGLQDATAKLYASGAAVDSPQFQQEYAKLQYLKKAIETDAQSSAAQKAQLMALQNTVAQNPDKYDIDKWNKALATYRLSDLPTRAQYNLANGIQTMPDDLTGLINESIPKIKETITTKTEVPFEKDGRAFTKTKETVNQNDLLGVSEGFAADYRNAKSIDRAWNNLTPDEQLRFVDGAKIAEQSFGRTIDPKTYYVYSQYKNRFGEKESLEGGAFTPERSEYAKGQEERNQADAAYAVINGLREMNPDVFDNISETGQGVVNPVGTGNYAISTRLEGTKYGTRQQQKRAPDDSGLVEYETVPNKIIAVRVNPSNPNVFEIRTEEDAIREAKQADENKNLVSKGKEPVSISQGWRKVPATQFETVWFSSNFKDAPTGIQQLKQAASKYGDVNKSGIVDPTQTRTSQGLSSGQYKQGATYSAEGITETGVPYGKKGESTTPQKQAAKTATRAQIKALVGTKGYEGYTEQELIDYYKSQGFNIQ